MSAYPVVEIFGPTIQGEGPDAGTPTHFVRFGGCDYRCGFAKDERGRWESEPSGEFVCDSLHAVLPEEVRKAWRLTTEEIVSALRNLSGDPRYVVLSGGNPALLNLSDLVVALHRLSWRVAIETQGSLWKPWIAYLDTVVVSPKPPSSRQPFKFADLDAFLDQLVAASPVHNGSPSAAYRKPLFAPRPQIALKVPIFDEKDLAFADVLAGHYAFPLYLSVVNEWRKPNTRDELIERYAWIVHNAQAYPNLQDAPVLPQLHVLVWSNDRGR